MAYRIDVAHNETDGVWFVHSSEVPGLNAEAPTLDSLVEIISDLAPELLHANGALPSRAQPIDLLIQHIVHTGVAHAA